MTNELTYWVALAHADHLYTRRKNELVVACFNRGETLADFFAATTEQWQTIYGVADDELPALTAAKEGLPNCSFLVEDLLEQGFQLLPITSEHYPTSLKRNLKYNSPVLLYAKGNVALLNSPCVAVVGSRSAGAVSLTFTQSVARRAAEAGKVVVSGYAKGVDTEALNAAVAAGGTSIVVLPQGITMFAAGFRTLHRSVSSGKVVVVSAFHPQAPWSVGLAMARNPIVYAFADDIYVAESDAQGGTFAGVTDGLRRGRTIYVRQPGDEETCANDLLIDMGAAPVDMAGEPIAQPEGQSREQILRQAITGHARSAKELATMLYGSDDRTRQSRVKMLLRRIDGVQTLATKPQKFLLPVEEPKLF